MRSGAVTEREDAMPLLLDFAWASARCPAARKSTKAHRGDAAERKTCAKFVFTRMTRMNTERAESSTAKTKLLHKELTGEILGGFFNVYNALGYGFLEHVYSNALSLELRNRGLRIEREVAVEVHYQGQPVGSYRMDMMVERLVVIEIKSTAVLSEADRRQLFNTSALPMWKLVCFSTLAQSPLSRGSSGL